MALLADIERYDPPNADFYAPARVDFAAYVQSLLDEEQGLDLREGWVPCTHRWLLSSDGILVAVTRVRHNISTAFLAENGGHIGYDVAPSHRGLGYGHAALRASLAEAQRLGIQRVRQVHGAIALEIDGLRPGHGRSERDQGREREAGLTTKHQHLHGGHLGG